MKIKECFRFELNDIKHFGCITFLLIMFFHPAWASDYPDFTGKIVDAETGEPINFVTIYSPSIYTASNADGEYVISEVQPDEQITFSHISYKTYKIDYAQVPTLIRLQPKSFELTEVIVTPRENIVNELKKVWNKYSRIVSGVKEREFPKLNFYYRQLTLADSIYTEYIECLLSAPTSVAVRNMNLIEGRFFQLQRDSLATIHNYFTFSQITPFTREKAKLQNVNTLLCADFENYYDLYLDKIIMQNGDDEIKVYRFEPLKQNLENTSFLAGKLYIRTKDCTIMRAELAANSMHLQYENPAIKIEYEKHFFILTYREDITFYPVVESVQGDSELELSSPEEKRNVHFKSYLFSVNCDYNKKGKKIKHKDKLVNKILKSEYDEEFWDKNPIVKRTEIEQQVLDNFKKNGYVGNVNVK